MSAGASHRHRAGYPALVLGGTALCASAALVLGHNLTREAIAARQMEDLRASLAEVVPAHSYENDLTADTMVLRMETGTDVLAYRGRRGGEVTAVAWRLRTQGYAGTIALVMGVDRTGRIQGVRVLTHTETPGLGDKLEVAKSDWIRGFDGRSLAHPTPGEWSVKKDGGYFDQFTGATITPRAVVRAVKEGLLFFERHRTALLDEMPAPTPEPAPAGAGPENMAGGMGSVVNDAGLLPGAGSRHE